MSVPNMVQPQENTEATASFEQQGARRNAESGIGMHEHVEPQQQQTQEEGTQKE